MPAQMKAFGKDLRRQGAKKAGWRESSLRTSKPGMDYVVRVMPRAERDLSILYMRIDADDSGAGARARIVNS